MVRIRNRAERLYRNLLLGGMHTIPVVLLLYLVKHKYPKTNNFYRSAKGLMVNFFLIFN